MGTGKRAYEPPKIPEDEQERLADLYSLRVLDTASETRFDAYTDLVADIFGFPVVLVSLVDRDRQWFKSKQGWSLTECSRDISFCGHALNHHGNVYVVPDTHKDPRFAGNPLVVDDPYIRFYAGTLVHGPRGYAIGTLCVIDYEPREFSEREARHLRQFAKLVENELSHVHDLEALRGSIEFSAYYDALTKLPNRRLMMDRLEHLIELCEADKRQVLVLLFNIKGLRMINQSYGSEVGDEILVQLADRLRECCPAGGTTARLQADECVLVAPGPGQRDAEYLNTLAEEARVCVDRPFTVRDREHYLDIQIGGSVFPEHGTKPVTLIERAAAAIHVPDRRTRSAVRFMSKADSLDITRNMEIESRLRRATEKQSFRLHYQPITSLSDGRMVSLEALLRWHDEELGNVSPGEFIPIAEQTGLIMPIGRWVIEEACRQLEQWRQMGQRELPIAVNVEAIQLQDAGFARMVIDQLEARNIAPGLLGIEVTEFSLVHNSRYVSENLQTLDEAGIQLFVDDFGTGYSSLEYFRRMPISGLKIDRSFIDGVPDDPNDTVLTRTMISMAVNLNLQSVAEGVETFEQLNFLRGTECHLVQGFFLARPMPASDVEKLPEYLF